MTHLEGEKKIKVLQKEFLSWVESHPSLRRLDPDSFNDIRHKVFRATFQAYRLGVVGLEEDHTTGLWSYFFGWLENHPSVRELSAEVLHEIAERCFRTTLDAFRVGAMVTSMRETNEVL
jgi:hypothetical protein